MHICMCVCYMLYICRDTLWAPFWHSDGPVICPSRDILAHSLKLGGHRAQPEGPESSCRVRVEPLRVCMCFWYWMELFLVSRSILYSSMFICKAAIKFAKLLMVHKIFNVMATATAMAMATALANKKKKPKSLVKDRATNKKKTRGATRTTRTWAVNVAKCQSTRPSEICWLPTSRKRASQAIKPHRDTHRDTHTHTHTALAALAVALPLASCLLPAI